MVMIVLKTPINFLEQDRPHFFCRGPPRIVRQCPNGHFCKRNQNQVAKKESDNFEMQFNAKDFSPEDITVKMAGRQVIIEAKYEKKTENHFESQHIVKKFSIPEEYNLEDVVSTINKEGMMTISANRPKVEEPKERVVPVQILPSSSKNSNELQHKESSDDMNTNQG